MNSITYEGVVSAIVLRLETCKSQLEGQFRSARGIGYFFVDDLLPVDWVQTVFEHFPNPEAVVQKKSLREYKYVGVQMDEYAKILEEVIYAFQDPRVIQCIGSITGNSSLVPDEKLYAGGLSMMGKGNFLNPHLDNSHDKDRRRWRKLNLLYYVTPDWKPEFGGNLELWPEGPKNAPLMIAARCNRLIVMETHQHSWHSVSKVLVDRIRCCVSNYYFSAVPWDSDGKFHVTTFRGRPEECFKNALLKIDSALRMGLRKIFKRGIRENPHVYRKASGNKNYERHEDS